jgi:hypothetical protein
LGFLEDIDDKGADENGDGAKSEGVEPADCKYPENGEFGL